MWRLETRPLKTRPSPKPLVTRLARGMTTVSVHNLGVRCARAGCRPGELLIPT